MRDNHRKAMSVCTGISKCHSTNRGVTREGNGQYHVQGESGSAAQPSGEAINHRVRNAGEHEALFVFVSAVCETRAARVGGAVERGAGCKTLS